MSFYRLYLSKALEVLFQGSRTIDTILGKGIMRTNPRCIYTPNLVFLTQKVYEICYGHNYSRNDVKVNSDPKIVLDVFCLANVNINTLSAYFNGI